MGCRRAIPRSTACSAVGEGSCNRGSLVVALLLALMCQRIEAERYLHQSFGVTAADLSVHLPEPVVVAAQFDRGQEAAGLGLWA